jgi:hypothetical protein
VFQAGEPKARECGRVRSDRPHDQRDAPERVKLGVRRLGIARQLAGAALEKPLA